MKEAALSYDLRQTIFASFYRVGFDLHDLTSSEKQRMEVIQLYPYLKNGEIWQDIKQELTDLVSNLSFNLYRRTFAQQVMTDIGLRHLLKKHSNRLKRLSIIRVSLLRMSNRRSKMSWSLISQQLDSRINLQTRTDLGERIRLRSNELETIGDFKSSKPY